MRHAPNATAPTADRTVLLLQGPASWFFTRLGRALRTRGARVARVLACPGDALFWRGPGGVAFRGGQADWPGWLAETIDRERVTDLVCLGDGRPLHRDGIAVARAAGLRLHVLEQGLLRPGWLTLDPRGTGPRASVPRDAAAIRAAAAALPDPPAAAPSGTFAGYAAMDVAWELSNLVARPLWPRWRRHMLHHPAREWAAWLRLAALWPVRRARTARTQARIAAHRGPVFVMALQLETDFAVRRDGPPGGVRAALAETVAAFAAHAPGDAALAVKRHPLDCDLARWRAETLRQAAIHGVADRVAFLDCGDVRTVTERAAGMVTVNSTAGFSALCAGLPVKALGRAAWAIEGLADTRPLAAFLAGPRPPEPGLAEAFARVLAATVQMPGAFDGPGAAAAAERVAAAILARP